MYFLKDIQGKRIAFPTLKELFVFLEAEAGQRFSHRACNYSYHIARVIGENFTSKITQYGVDYEDTRNENCFIKENPFEKQWLATTNKYVVLDAFGRVVSRTFILERYDVRFKALHERNYRYSSHVNSSPAGTKYRKNWSKRYREHYRGYSVCRTELHAITSKDEFDLMAPVRLSRKSDLKARNLQYDTANFRDDIRSWKNQSKKNKQWQ